MGKKSRSVRRILPRVKKISRRVKKINVSIKENDRSSQIRLQNLSNSSTIQRKNSIDPQNQTFHREKKKIHKGTKIQRRRLYAYLSLFLCIFIISGVIIGVLLITFNKTNNNLSTTIPIHPFIPLLKPGDPIFSLFNTVAGGATDGFDGHYSRYSTELTPSAIDHNLTTKYVNADISCLSSSVSISCATNTGFYVSPTINIATVTVGLRFGIANDVPARDPLTLTLEGTNSFALNSSFAWTLIYNGSTGIDSISTPSRLTYGAFKNFSNTIAYRSYRVLITSKRGSDPCVQYSEFELWGYY